MRGFGFLILFSAACWLKERKCLIADNKRDYADSVSAGEAFRQHVNAASACTKWGVHQVVQSRKKSAPSLFYLRSDSFFPFSLSQSFPVDSK
jgi:hypothetical protein